MSKTPIQNGESSLRPKARLIKTIGEDLISNNIVAIIELVKNSYDANSPIVVVEFQGEVERIVEGKKEKRVIKKDLSKLIILDEGDGMDLNIIENVWMEPATNFKKKSVNENKLRRFTGEKGIGRFASAKLASKLDIYTRKKDDNEIVVNFNWDDFSDEEKYLEEIKTKWFVREPQTISTKGTILELNELNNSWDEHQIRELRVSLSRLLSPISPTEDFLIELRLPDGLEDLSGLIERPETLNRPDYYIKGSISLEGIPEIVYFSKKNNESIPLSLSIEEFNLRNPSRIPICGPFQFEFKVWNRDSDSIKSLANDIESTVKNVKGDLDDLAGISIYRDNFRVIPYGNKNNDWLNLNIRRVNNPTMRLSNNQIVGYVSIGLDTNPELKDQSNREGIVDSQSFVDLKEFIILILNEVEIRRYNERPRENDDIVKGKESLFDRFSLKEVLVYLNEKLPENNEVLYLIQQKEIEINEGVKKVQEIISRYRRLTTLGQLIDVILHDGGNYLGKIDIQANLIKRQLKNSTINFDGIESNADKIIKIREDFAQLFKRIEPFGGRKRGRPKQIIVEDIICNQFSLAHRDLEKLNINYELPSSKNTVTIDEAELGIILMNLIQNSVYWLESVNHERKIFVDVARDLDSLSIIFSDNGPGIKEGTELSVFDPYFSTKPDGIGLGLTIVGELVSEYNGDFYLLNNGPLEGANFKITFKHRI
jgi:nitrogen-specific signal transduction histidine kinase